MARKREREEGTPSTVRYRRGQSAAGKYAQDRTGTAPPSAPAVVAAPLASSLGRYRVEHELGAGGMGVVYAAFDPDLERHIAIKVLRGANATSESRARLLREARAMARLSHVNVITVYEVGSSGDRDYVAMELIRGTTLAEWLRAGKRTPAAIIAAFLAAGRGLAAAHAAGIVHRDFKPRNVLRSHDGRVVVTDFGLARDSDGVVSTTLDMAGESGEGSRSSGALEDLTVTGAMLGTPPYMAPEQWRGDAITPMTDQFAYCVALWEALAGQRPYRAATVEALRRQIARGPAEIDASSLPRRVRGLLLRGLDPNPARRWPSMDALLARLATTQRRRGLVVACMGGVVIAAAGWMSLQGVADAPSTGCETAGSVIDRVRPSSRLVGMEQGASGSYRVALDAAAWSWRATRNAACHAPLQVRTAQLQCLDGALDRIRALGQVPIRGPGAELDELRAQMIDPQICIKPIAAEVPRLTLMPTRDVIAAYGLYVRGRGDHKPLESEIAAVASDPGRDPCARVISALAFDLVSTDLAAGRSMMSRAISSADQCGDDRLRAELLIRSVRYEREWPAIGPKGEAALARAQVAASRVMQPEIAAELAAQRLPIARQRGDWDDAFRLVDTELAVYRARGLAVRLMRAVLVRNELRLARRDPSDLEAIVADVSAWRGFATANHQPELARQLDVQGAVAQFHRGEIAAAHGALVRLWQGRPAIDRPVSRHRIEGDVVDEHGRPVAGATVATAAHLFADSVGIGLPLQDHDDTLQITTTDGAGHFALNDTASEGAIAAQLEDRRSRPRSIADRVTLVLARTRTVSGKVEFSGVPYTRIGVSYEPSDLPGGQFYALAPIAMDGSFSMSGVTLGAIRLGVVVRGRGNTGTRMQFRALPASSKPVVGLALSILSSKRALDVVVRSAVAAPLEGAHVVLLPGRQQIRNLGELFSKGLSAAQQIHPKPVEPGRVPAELADTARSGDLFAHMEHVVEGELTICACALPGNLMDPAVLRRLEERAAQLRMTCKHVGSDLKAVVLDVPPQQRLD